MYSSPPPSETKNTLYEQHIPLRKVQPPIKFLRLISAEPRGRLGLDANARLLVIKKQYEIGLLTAENFEAKDDSKSSRSLEAPQKEHKL
jgi:hypothetical protein